MNQQRTPRTIFFCVKCHKVIEGTIFVEVVGLGGLVYHQQCWIDMQDHSPHADIEDHWTLD